MTTTNENPTQTLATLYKEKIIHNLTEKIQYKNIHQVPKIIKIQINRGLGSEGQNNTI